MSPVKEFTGTLRPRITHLGRIMAPITQTDRLILEGQGVYLTDEKEVAKDHFKIEWIEDDDVTKVVWTEELKCLPGVSFVPQIVGEGNFRPTGAMYVDKDNLRHRVLPVDMGILGAAFNQANVKKDNDRESDRVPYKAG